MKNNKFILDHKYIHDYGTLDKTLMGSKTTKTLIKFIIKGLSRRTEEWKEAGEEIVEYWLDCSEHNRIKRVSARMGYAKRQNSNDEN